MQVVFLSNVLEYFDNLVTILYEKEYFGFEEASLEYVMDLYDDIVTTLPIRPHRPAPAYFDKYGKNMEYAVFIKNKHTTWYAFFRVYRNNGEEIYQVRYIANNHTDAHHLELS